jgi:P-type conjugative transfer protein TrbG
MAQARPSRRPVVKTALASLLVAVPIAAHAQGVQVPSLMAQYNANAQSDIQGARASASASTVNLGAPSTGGAVPASMPPPIQLLSPSAPLTPKEHRGAVLVQRWKDRRTMPTADADGTVRYVFGASIPSLLCSPLFVCAIELQAGEVVQLPITLGDKVNWTLTPTVTGSGASMTTLIAVKPHDAGLVTNVMIPTNQRTYSIVLKSTQARWMPKIAFSYPEDTSSAWATYSITTGRASAAAAATTAPVYDQAFTLSGDNPPWRPTRVMTDGSKTIIEFPPAGLHAQTPTLVGLVDQGWFSKDAEQFVNYRAWGNQFVVDQVLTKAALVYGVGSQRTEVKIERRSR